MLYYKNNQFNICPFIANYTAYGQKKLKYTNDKKWWTDFINKWWHHENLTFKPVNPTKAQEIRLREINELEIPEGFQGSASGYVETGLLPRDEEGRVLPLFASLTEQPDPTNTTLITVYQNAVGQYLDELAQERDYDSILSLCTYATSSNDTYKAEGEAGVVCRDTTWDTMRQILADVVSKERLAPTMDELLSEFPSIAWPN